MSNPSLKPPTVVYRVDAAQPLTTTQPVADRDVPNQALFSHTFGSQWGEHEITIQVLQAEAPYILGAFFIFPINTTALDSDEASNSPNAPPATPNSTSYNATDSWTSLNNPSGAQVQRTVRALAGLLGVTTLILVVMSAFLIVQRIRQRRSPLQKKTSSGRPGEHTQLRVM